MCACKRFANPHEYSARHTVYKAWTPDLLYESCQFGIDIKVEGCAHEPAPDCIVKDDSEQIRTALTR